MNLAMKETRERCMYVHVLDQIYINWSNETLLGMDHIVFTLVDA